MRRLLQFFGPYVPIDLMVPEKHAKRAEEILREVLVSRTAAKETNPILNEEARAKPRPIGAAVVAALVLLAGLMLGLTLVPEKTPPAPEKRAVSLAFVAVDDERAIVDEASMKKLSQDQLPRGLRFAKEQVSVGPGRQAVREYAWLVRNESETMENARARLEAWTKTLALPEGDRVAVAEYLEYDEDNATYEHVGFRTYLLKGAPVLTEADVADASALPDSNGGSGWLVRLQFTPQGAARFESYTGENLKRRFAIVVDGMVMSAPGDPEPDPGRHRDHHDGGGENRETEGRREAARRGPRREVISAEWRRTRRPYKARRCSSRSIRASASSGRPARKYRASCPSGRPGN